MEYNNKIEKEPQDSARKPPSQSREMHTVFDEKSPQDCMTSKKNDSKDVKSNHDIKMEEEEQKKKADLKKQEIDKKKEYDLINFKNELQSVLTLINTAWEKNRENFSDFYQKEIIPKLNEYLNYPCITAIEEKIELIFRFLCNYFLLRKQYLKELCIYELLQMMVILVNNFNIFVKTPNNINIQNYELIDDRLFYKIFKEYLPEKEMENHYGNLVDKNCMYKNLVEFLFQCGFIDSFIDDVLLRNDISPSVYSQLSYFPFHSLNYCKKDFLIKKNYNIKMIKIYNSKLDFYLSDKNPWIKKFDEMKVFGYFTTSNFLDMHFGIYNHFLDEMIKTNKIDCEIFSNNVLKISEYFLKDQKINMRIEGICLASELCQLLKNFCLKYKEYRRKYNDIEKIYNYILNNTVLYLNKINIINLIFGENIHEGVVQRAYSVISFLYKFKSFNSNQIKFLWNLSQTKYQSISNCIITLFGQLLPEFSSDDCNNILNIVCKMDYKEVNEITLKLLENFFVVNERREILLNILFKFSNELSYEKGLEKNIIIRSREILVKLLFNINYHQDLIKYIKDCIFHLQQFNLVDTYSSTLSQILDEFNNIRNRNTQNDDLGNLLNTRLSDILKDPDKLKTIQINDSKDSNELYKKFDNKIENFGMFISYLDDNYKLFPIYMNCLIKIIKIFKFFYCISLDKINQISFGNFDYDQLLNIELLYNNYRNFMKEHMNFCYNLNFNNNNHDHNNMDIDIETNDHNKIIFNNMNGIEIEEDNENYIRNIIKDFVKFFKESFLVRIDIPSNDEIKNIILNKFKLFFEKFNYYGCIQNILKIIYTNHLRGNIHFKINYLNFLYKIAKNTEDIDPSIQWYYNLLYDLFKSQISISNVNLLTNQDLEHLIKENIVKSNYKILPISAFNVTDIFCIYVNQKNDNAIYSPLINKYTEIKNFKNFYGFELIWKFFLLTKNDEIYKKALNVLMNILELTTQNFEYRKYFINTIFGFLKQKINQIQNNQEEKISFIRNLKLISIANGTKVSKNIYENKNDDNAIELVIKNFYFSSQNNSDNISKIKISKEMKIKNLKEYLINTIICTQNNLMLYNQDIDYNNNLILYGQNNINEKMEDNNMIEENKMNLLPNISSIDDLKKEVYKTNIIINYKNKVLQDDEFTLADYKVDNNDNLTILKGSGCSEQEYKPTENELKEGYETIKMVFQNNVYFGEDVMKESIIKHKGNFEDAALYLTEPQNVKLLQKQIEERKKGVEQNNEEIIVLEEDKINLLIEVLNQINDKEIEINIWQLFSEIKYPQNIISNNIGSELSKILADGNLNKMILNLRIINSLIFDDNFCKYNKLSKEEKSNWISKFIKDENIISHIFMTLSNLNMKLKNHFQIYLITNIFINFFHKIILKIDILIRKENGNENVSPGIKLLRQLNSENNIIINNNANNKEEKEKGTEEFEIINKNEAINFIFVFFKFNAIESFLKILNIILFTNIKEEEKRNIIENIFEIMLTLLLLNIEGIKQFNQAEKNSNILTNIICNEKNLIIGNITKNFIKALLSNIFSFIQKDEIDSENNTFNIFFLSLSDKIMNGNNYMQQFYELLGTLLIFQSNQIVKNRIDPLIYKLLNDVYNLCSNFNPYDNISRNNIIFETYLLYTCVKFYKDNLKIYINKMLNEEKKDFIQLIYNCLFEISREKNIIKPFKFTDNSLRQHSFSLLIELIISEQKYLLNLLPSILSHHKKLKELNINKCITPFDVNLRSPQEKFVGLRNFGCTCYLNSLFQQMFMIPSFRHDILNNFIFKYNNVEEESRYSVMYNMQVTFQNLISGWMSPYPPLRFIKSFLSAFNGEPIPLGIMQDSDEFLSILCDNLEKEAKMFHQENFLENSFKGKISNEILSLENEYPYYSQSEEPFYRITLDIKGHKTLEEALDAYIKGEILDGDNKYYVEKYKRKISIRKSSSLKILGNEIIIHLKRFEFDFMNFTNKKLNDYLKFPLEINFKKWTRAFLRIKDSNISKELLNITKEEEHNLVDGELDYILTGILIHGGTNLQSGHYYSFIMDQETGKWHQYNDNTISDYNIENDLEKECFGNLPEKNDNYGRTAYLLFYTNKKCFRNQELLKSINVNENLLTDVYNENANFLNMNIYTNMNYFKFIKELSINGSCILDDDISILDQKSNTISSNLKKEDAIYSKVFSTIKGDDEDNDDDSIDENCNDENTITNNPNFEQIYKKCKQEIGDYFLQQKINKKNLKNIYSKKHIIKLYFNYIFGIIFPYIQNNNNLLLEGLQTLINILKNYSWYSLWVLKQIEKNIDVFTELLFKFGTTENEMDPLNKSIIEFFQITFDNVYHYEKDILLFSEEIKYFVKNDKGKYIITKESKSLILRLIRKLFCENLEKSRVEYSKNSLYLVIFYNFVKNYPEISSVCCKYLKVIISLISNNTLSDIKSETNPNYLMGNMKGYNVNNNYISIFSDIILRCVTPGMENTRTFSPYYTGIRKKSNNNSEIYIDFSKYPHLPQNWEKMLSIEFFVNFVLFHNYCKSKEIICHLCYGDEKTSVKILSLVNEFIKMKNIFLPFKEKVFNNTLSVFEIKDALEFIRLDTLFQLNDSSGKEDKEPVDIEENDLFNFYYEQREKNINFVLYFLYNVGKAIEKYDIISKYFERYKNKLEWIKYFLIEIKTDPKMKEDFAKNNAYIMNQHPDLFQVIQESLIKRFGFDSN